MNQHRINRGRRIARETDRELRRRIEAATDAQMDRILRDIRVFEIVEKISVRGVRTMSERKRTIESLTTEFFSLASTAQRQGVRPNDDLATAFRPFAERILEAEKFGPALKKYLEYFGAPHDDDCPMDDTCDCSWAETNRAVNNLAWMLNIG